MAGVVPLEGLIAPCYALADIIDADRAAGILT
jgi:hypothetical protein